MSAEEEEGGREEEAQNEPHNTPKYDTHMDPWSIHHRYNGQETGRHTRERTRGNREIREQEVVGVYTMAAPAAGAALAAPPQMPADTAAYTTAATAPAAKMTPTATAALPPLVKESSLVLSSTDS